jgi:transcriptional regulator with XRE-family HTH domain
MNEEFRVGMNIRRLREERGLSLRALADRCGLSINAISRIERGANSPTVTSLEQIARALGVSIVSLFEGDSHKLILYRSEEFNRSIEKGGLLFENLIVENSSLPFQCVRISAQPGHNQLPEVAHPGYEFNYCLAGSVDFIIDEKIYTLNRGDCICFDARQPHCWRNHANEVSSLLVVTYSSEGTNSFPVYYPEIEEIFRSIAHSSAE